MNFFGFLSLKKLEAVLSKQVQLIVMYINSVPLSNNYKKLSSMAKVLLQINFPNSLTIHIKLSCF